MNKQSFLILHGLGGSGSDHWQTWLAKELVKREFHVCYPSFSNVDSPDKSIWLNELSAAMETIPKYQPLTVITHSLGCLLWLHYSAGQNKRLAKRVILIAPPSPKIELAAAKSFFPVPLEKGSIIKAAEETFFVHSSNDHYCSLADANEYMNIGLPALVFPNMGHINAESGHGEWPWILDQCLKHDSVIAAKRVI